MRNFMQLDRYQIDSDTGVFRLFTQAEDANSPQLALKIEGEYIAISASYGALEVALRPNLGELRWALSHLVPFEGLQTTSRQIGSTQAFLAIGLHADGALILRPTILADATGHLTMNLRLSSEARIQLFQWLGVTGK